MTLTVHGEPPRRLEPEVETALDRCGVAALATAERVTGVELDLAPPRVRVCVGGGAGDADVIAVLLDQAALVDGSVTAEAGGAGTRWSVDIRG